MCVLDTLLPAQVFGFVVILVFIIIIIILLAMYFKKQTHLFVEKSG